jgi:type I restriction enzyme S subunit
MMYTETIKLESVITDIAAGPFGSNLKISCFVDYGFPIIDGANLKGFKVTDNVTKFVTEEKARSLHRSIAKRNDVIVTISGTLGQIAYIPENSMFEEYLCSQRQFRVSFDTERVFVPYLVYYFHSREGQHKILSFANQTGVPALSQPLKNFRNIEVDLPDIDTQKQIASVMLSLDDKIELNTAINENLEQQAQALYKAWFVDFEPFGGVMPDDWQIVPLDELCDSISKKHRFNKPELIFLNTGDVENGMVLHNNYSEVSQMPGQAKKSIAINDILYSEIRPINKHFTYVNFNADDYVVSTKLMVLRAKGISPRRLYQFLTMPDTLNELQHEAETRSGTFPQIRFDNIQQLEMIVASEQIENEYSERLNTIYSMIDSNNAENQRLAALRDTLLPKLMNGEIDVSEVKI